MMALSYWIKNQSLTLNQLCFFWRDSHSEMLGDYFKIFCSSGLPKPIIRWSRNGQELTGNEPGVSILEDGTLLILASLSPLDNGEYTCAAVNEAGSTEKKYQLKVNGNPPLTIGFSYWP